MPPAAPPNPGGRREGDRSAHECDAVLCYGLDALSQVHGGPRTGAGGVGVQTDATHFSTSQVGDQ